MRYIDFVRGVGYSLTPAQESFARVAFDGEDPPDVSDRSAVGVAGQKLWNSPFVDRGRLIDASSVPASARRVVAAVCGRGSGKTLLGGTRALHLAVTVDLSRLGKGEVAFCPVVAPDLSTAEQTVRAALGAAEVIGVPVEKVGDDGFTVLRAGGRKVRIEARSASIRGTSIRGRSLVCAVLDECAFFRDRQTGKINDQDIFDALRPRIMAGGQLIILSSPWAELGLLYELWKRNYGHPIDAFVAHAPTELMRPDDQELLATVASLRTVDPEKCAREYDAVFMTANERMFFDPRAINSSLIEVASPYDPEDTVAVGGDFAFRRNSSALVAVACRGNGPDRVYEVRDILEQAPHGKPLRPSEVCERAAEFTKTNGADAVVADSHYRETVVEHLWDNGKISLISAPEGALGKAETYQAARTVMHEGQLKIPKNIGDKGIVEKLLRQMREVSSRPLAGGAVAIDSPLWATGEHGDLVSALVLAIWRCFRMGWVAPAKSTVDNMDAIEREIARRDQEAAEKADRMARFTGMRDNSRHMY